MNGNEEKNSLPVYSNLLLYMPIMQPRRGGERAKVFKRRVAAYVSTIGVVVRSEKSWLLSRTPTHGFTSVLYRRLRALLGATPRAIPFRALLLKG